MKTSRLNIIAVIGLSALSGLADASPAPCSAGFVAALQSPGSQRDDAVVLACNLELSSSDVVVKRLIIEGNRGNGIRVQCNGAWIRGNAQSKFSGDAIEVRSTKTTDARTGHTTWLRPENIQIDGCKVEGSVRIMGMGINGQGAELLQPSRAAAYVKQVRDYAPRNIEFTNMSITGRGRIPFYVSPGVTQVRLANSEIHGFSRSTLLYLDAESSQNIIEGNDFYAIAEREQIAVDGSDYNRIANNRFHEVRHGGVYLYRNCGEGGVIRHTTPSHNKIVGNEFNFHSTGLEKPAVLLGARNGKRWYCWADYGYAFGSSADNRDFANNNEVVSNRVIGRHPENAISIGDASDADNVVGLNVQAASARSGRGGK